MKQKIIEFRNINLSFKSKTIFKDFNFIINSGEKIIVFGKSGTGKSTLLNLLLGFKQPESGEIFFNGEKITAQNIWDIRKQIAYVDQDVMMGEGHVQKIIAEYFSFAANSKIKFTPLELTELLEKFDLEPVILTKNISQLSGGEKQRLALVVALLLKRPVMALDEVTSSLDPASKTIVIRELLKNSKSTLLIITHDEEWQYQKNVRIFDFKEKKWKQ